MDKQIKAVPMEPTDEEIRQIAEKHYGTCMTAQELTFARAILAQFTQPSPAESSFEPVAVVVSDYAIHWAGAGPIAPLCERTGVKVGSKLVSIEQVQAYIKRERDAALEEAANTAFDAPITADMLNSDDANAVALHAASRIRRLKSEAAQPSEDRWRDLALQFDEHRMQAIGWLKACVDRLPEPTAEVIKEFLKAPPLPGQKVLADRIASMCPPVQPSAEPSHNEQNLAMAIKKVVSSARRHLDPTLYTAKRAEEAWALVQRLGLEGSPLREAANPNDSEINDSQQRILDAAMRWAEQREVGPTPAKEAWRSLTLRVQAELNYTAACAVIDAQPSDSQDEVSDTALINWLDDNANRFNFGFHIGLAPVGNISIQTVGNLKTDFRLAVKSVMRTQEKS